MILQAMMLEVSVAITVLDADAETYRGCMGHVSADGRFAFDIIEVITPETCESEAAC